jgi:hypothetical protein
VPPGRCATLILRGADPQDGAESSRHREASLIVDRMPSAISIQCIESGERADRLIAELHNAPGDVPRFQMDDIVPFLYLGDDVDEGRRVAEKRLASIDPAWHEVARVL